MAKEQSGKGKKNEKIIKTIELPEDIIASMDGRLLTIKGRKGEVSREIKQRNVLIQADGKKVVIESKSGKKEDKKVIGSLTAHIKNMIRGSSQNHTYTLKICAGHFPMTVSIGSSKLTVKNFLGEKVPRVLQLKIGVDVKVEGDLIHVTGASKEIAGQVSADIEQLTRRPGYDTRIFQDGIYIINKDGKELK